MIHRKVGVAAGLIGIYYGETKGRSWMRRTALEADPISVTCSAD